MTKSGDMKPSTPVEQKSAPLDANLTPDRDEGYASTGSTGSNDSDDHRIRRGNVAHGVLSNGYHFAVPETESVMAALLSLRAWRTPFNWIWMGTCLLTALTLALPLPAWFYIAQSLFWRFAYNIGLGYILRQQSNHRWWEHVCRKYVFSSATLTRFVESCVLFIDAKVPRFKVKDYPQEFSSWMVYRFVVKVILANDVAAFYVLVLYCFYWPTTDGIWNSPTQWDGWIISRYVASAVLHFLALWSKSDAHRVIGDYAWYWGDFWFLLEKDLVFDGIFQMFPHPMYTVGYSFMYGSAIASRGYTLFYVSVASHIAQMIFLAFVENPHIDKTYNAITAPTPIEIERDRVLYGPPVEEASYRGNHLVYELPYFDRKELVTLKNFDIYRAGDFVMFALILYTTMTGLLVGRYSKDMTSWSGLGPISGGLLYSVVQCVCWRLFSTFFLGYVLRQQSSKNAWVNHFKGNTKLAFQNWKTIYNVSVTMMQLSFIVVFLRCQILYWYQEDNSEPALITSIFNYLDLDNSAVARAVVGVLLVLVNIYVSQGVYEVIGPFGYFYSDFFISDVPAGALSYSGIYRYLNNPDTSLGFAGYYGLVLLSPRNTWVVMLPLAIFSHVCAKFFEKWVEAPHLHRKYGKDQIRSEGGLRSEIKRRARNVRQSMKNKREEYEQKLLKLRKEIEETTKLYEKVATVISPKKEKKVEKSQSKSEKPDSPATAAATTQQTGGSKNSSSTTQATSSSAPQHVRERSTGTPSEAKPSKSTGRSGGHSRKE